MSAAVGPKPLEERKPLVDNEVERLVALGATVFEVLSTEGMDHYGGRAAGPGGQRVLRHLRPAGQARLTAAVIPSGSECSGANVGWPRV